MSLRDRIRSTVAVAALIIITSMSFSASAQSLVAGPIVVPGASVEKLFDAGFWTEGPAVGPDGRVYFCDITFTFAKDMEAGNCPSSEHLALMAAQSSGVSASFLG